MSITIKELAKECNVSHEAIRKKISNLPTNLQPTKEKGAYRLSNEAADFIRNKIQSVGENTQQSNKSNQPELDSLKAEIAALKKNEDYLKQLIATKDEQIGSLSQSLQQEQAISYEATKNITQLKLALDQEQAKGFWARLFGK